MQIAEMRVHTPDRNAHVFVELVTTEGHSGWGACYSERQQVVGAIGWLTRFVLGQNPLELEKLTETFHEISFWLGRGGAMTHAISGINLALWDCAGKILGIPVKTLLGGARHSDVKAYGSILFHPTETLETRIEEILERNFRAIKLGWDPFGRQDIDEDRRLVERARAAAGTDVDIMVDAGGSGPYYAGSLKTALEQAAMLAEYRVRWFEEPLRPDDVAGYRRLTDSSPVRISAGEVLTGRRAFRPIIAERMLDIIQPDVCKVGGLSEMRRLAWAAWDADLELVPHGWNTAIGVAADLHLMSTAPTPGYVEFNVGNVLVEDIMTEAFSLNPDGTITVPEAPGLGITIDGEMVSHLSSSGFRSPSWTWDEENVYVASPREPGAAGIEPSALG